MKLSLILHRTFLCSALLLGTAVAMSACDDKDDTPTIDSNISVSTTTVSLDGMADEASAQVTLDIQKDWRAYSENDWITITPDNGGKDDRTITITARKNPTTEARTGIVTISSGASRKDITVNQSAGDGTADEGDITCPFPGYRLVWNDEFDRAGSLNPQDWTHEVKNAGWVNNEKQNYVKETTPEGNWVTRITGGKLQIRCLKENGKVYSGRVYAKVKEGWKYGYIEASIKLPKGKGTWPAFWMMPVNFHSWPADGEIDIMEEVGANPNYVSSSLHATAHVHSNNTQVTHEMFCEGAEDDFHTYAIKWTHQNITTYVDGKEQLSYDNRGLGRDDWPYDDPFYVILNLAWGGNWGGYRGIDESALPTTMEIDYVRVFQ